MIEYYIFIISISLFFPHFRLTFFYKVRFCGFNFSLYLCIKKKLFLNNTR